VALSNSWCRGGTVTGWRATADVICGAAMSPLRRYSAIRARFLGWQSRSLSLKAVTFAVVGLINTVIDYCVFLVAQSTLVHSPAAMAAFAAVAAACRCGSATGVSLVAANMVSWAVAVSGSYVMNSSITFAAESGGKLRWRDYAAFAASGVAGWLANTAVLVFAAQVLLLPVWLAKALSVVAGFFVNFLLSHYVVFRPRGTAGDGEGTR
jgi:putative flippase GtrA